MGLTFYNMDENQLKRQEVDTVSDKPATINVRIRPKNKWHRWAMKYKLMPSSKTFEIYGATLHTMSQISKTILDVKSERGSSIEWAIDQVANHIDKAKYIIALAIHNKPGEPSKKLVDFLSHNMEAIDYYVCFGLIIEKLNISAFTNTIIYFQDLNILKSEKEKVSPVVQTEIIASGESLEAHASIFAGASIT